MPEPVMFICEHLALHLGHRTVSEIGVEIGVRQDMGRGLRHIFSCAQRGDKRGMKLKRDTLVLGHLVCILLNLVPVSSWIPSSQFCRGAQHLIWELFCPTRYKSKCRESSGCLLLQNSFGGREVSGLQSKVPGLQSKVPCCSACGLSHGL